MLMDERAAVRRLLQRVGFGPRPAELDRAAAAGFDATLSALLDATTEAGGAAPALQPLPAAADRRREAAELLRAQLDELRRWWLNRMVVAEHPLAERLTFFWHGVFATSVQKVRSASMMLAQNQTLRRLGSGEFRELVAAMAVDPAMLVWLDGQRNQRGRPNENLARELMELFTLGVGNYTEDDVKQAARALTGWRVDRMAGTASFDRRRHDDAVLTVLGHSGRMGLAELVGVLVEHPQCARFVASRIWQRFVSDTPPSAERTDELAAHAGTVRELLRAVLSSPEFRAPVSVMVRQPVEWLVASYRALGVTVAAADGTGTSGTSGGSGGSAGWRAVGAGLQGLGQQLFAPPSVGGWPAGPAWLTTASARTRLVVAQAVVTQAAAAEAAGAMADTGLAGIRELPPGQRVHAAGELLSVDWTPRTAGALAEVAGDPLALLALALISPENLVSA